VSAPRLIKGEASLRAGNRAENMEAAQLKAEFLRLLKEDEEFRYAVAGLLGFREQLAPGCHKEPPGASCPQHRSH